MRQKNKGFTLVEMVITVAIFAILLGILVPSLMKSFLFWDSGCNEQPIPSQVHWTKQK